MESLSTNLLAKWYIPIKILGDYKMSRDLQTTWPRPLRRIRTFFPHSVRCFFCLASSSVSGFYYGIMALLGENTSRNYSTASRQAFPKVQNKLFCFYRLLFSLVWLYFLNHKYSIDNWSWAYQAWVPGLGAQFWPNQTTVCTQAWYPGLVVSSWIIDTVYIVEFIFLRT